MSDGMSDWHQEDELPAKPTKKSFEFKPEQVIKAARFIYENNAGIDLSVQEIYDKILKSIHNESTATLGVFIDYDLRDEYNNIYAVEVYVDPLVSVHDNIYNKIEKEN